MRIAVLIADDLYVRSFVTSGALAELAGEHELVWLGSDTLAAIDDVRSQRGYHGTVRNDPRRVDLYDRFRHLRMAVNRRRSSSMAIRVRDMRRRDRWLALALALPGVRSVKEAFDMRRLGPNDELRGVLRDIDPDLVVAPTAGTDALVLDLVREARNLGIPSLVLVNGWDNVSSKMAFPCLPDFIAVWGPQSAEHAVRIHGFEPSRVFPIGVPTFQGYFEFDRTRTPTPYPFEYVLFAGCAVAFDERSALKELDDALTAAEIDDVRIVYRPHPWRHPRLRDDFVREADFRHVVIDAQVRDAYQAAAGEYVGTDEFLPALDYYPGLVGHARLVVCPLSTMVVEAALLDRPVLLLAYDDEVHPLPPSVIARFAHFEGVDAVDGFRRADRLEDLGPQLLGMLRAPADGAIRDRIRRWLTFDERTYSERRAALRSALTARQDLASACGEEFICHWRRPLAIPAGRAMRDFPAGAQVWRRGWSDSVTP